MAKAQGEQDLAQKYGDIVAKAWEDPAFKRELMEKPTEVFRAGGIPIPETAGLIAKSVDDDHSNFCGFAMPRYTKSGKPTGLYDRLLELNEIVEGKVEGVIYYSLPPKPASSDFADEQLAEVAGYLYRVGTACSKSGSGSNHYCGGNVVRATQLMQTQLRVSPVKATPVKSINIQRR